MQRRGQCAIRACEDCQRPPCGATRSAPREVAVRCSNNLDRHFVPSPPRPDAKLHEGNILACNPWLKAALCLVGWRALALRYSVTFP